MSAPNPNPSAGTQIVSLIEIRGPNHSLVHPRGAVELRSGSATVRVEAHRDRLLAVKRGEIAWPEVDAWRQQLHRDFEHALAETKLPAWSDFRSSRS